MEFWARADPVGGGATKEKLRSDLVLALMKMKNFGKKAWLRIVGKERKVSRVKPKILAVSPVMDNLSFLGRECTEESHHLSE